MTFASPKSRPTVAACTAAMLAIGALATLLPSGCGSLKSGAAPVAANPPARAGTGAKLSYNEHIQPILAENCFPCHGPDSASRKGKLRLDRFEFATAKPYPGSPAIVPGKLDQSEMVDRITATD